MTKGLDKLSLQELIKEYLDKTPSNVIQRLVILTLKELHNTTIEELKISNPELFV